MKKLMNYLSIGLILFALVLFNSGSFQCAKAPQPIKLTQLEASIQQTIESVVHIINETQGWQGSGVIIRPDLILTAQHVVEGGEEFTITTNDGFIFKAYRAVSSKKYDVAFVKIPTEINLLGYDFPVKLKPAQLGSVKECRLGQQVYVIGSPYGKLNFNSVTFGIISGLDRSYNFKNLENKDYGWKIAFTTDSAGHPGNSGCPIFTLDGKVRGILVGRSSPVLVYCVPVDLVFSDIEEIKLLFVLDKYYFERK